MLGVDFVENGAERVQPYGIVERVQAHPGMMPLDSAIGHGLDTAIFLLADGIFAAPLWLPTACLRTPQFGTRSQLTCRFALDRI